MSLYPRFAPGTSRSRSSGQVLITSSLVSQPRWGRSPHRSAGNPDALRRASRYRSRISRPASLAALMCSDGRSSRSGWLLISRAVPVAAPGAEELVPVDVDGAIACRSCAWTDGPMMLTRGFSQARQESPGHLGPGLVEVGVQRTPRQMSKSDRISSGQSTVPSCGDVQFRAVEAGSSGGRRRHRRPSATRACGAGLVAPASSRSSSAA